MNSNEEIETGAVQVGAYKVVTIQPVGGLPYYVVTLDGKRCGLPYDFQEAAMMAARSLESQPTDETEPIDVSERQD